MYKFRALVAESGVVFVGFDHEEGCVAKPRRDAEVHRHAADQEARRHVGVFENPGQHRAGRRLAVRAGNAEYPAPLQHVSGQPLRTGNVGQALVENRFQQWVAARNCVADDENVWLECQLVSGEAFDQLDTGAAQLIAHRRINVGVATGNLVAGFNCQLGDAAHESTADTQNVNVHVTETRLEWARFYLDRVTMTRHERQRPSTGIRASIASAAARLMAEDGITDYHLAKRKAARQLGLPEHTAFPDNAEVEAELRAYRSLYQGEEHEEMLQAMRQPALDLMELLEPFRPYLTGSVLDGTAGEHSRIDSLLFADSAKEVEIFLLNRGIGVEHADPRNERVEAVLV